jgi:hypothetical protein
LTRELFTDRNLGRQFPDRLTAAGLVVHRHDDYFAQDCSDETWLTEIGQRGWVAITRDQRIRYKPNERQAVIDARATLLILVGRATSADLATNFINSTDRIESFLTRHAPPLIAKIFRASSAEREKNARASGSIEIWYPKR